MSQKMVNGRFSQSRDPPTMMKIKTCGAPCGTMRYATFTSWGEH